MSKNPTLVNDFEDILTHMSQLEHRSLKLIDDKNKLIDDKNKLIDENKELIEENINLKNKLKELKDNN